jgi:hypothetical protein
MIWLIVIALIILVIYIFISKVENQSPWQQRFDTLKFSSDEFYASCEEAIKKYEIPDVTFSRVTYFEDGTMRTKREYLHLVHGEHIYDFCAAPYGTGFFVSYWYATKPSLTRKFMRMFPRLAQFAESKTYYQLDTEAMFKGFVHDGMLAAIDAMTSSKGVRALTEFERRMPDNKG